MRADLQARSPLSPRSFAGRSRSVGRRHRHRRRQPPAFRSRRRLHGDRQGAARSVPRFPKAKYIAHRAEWEDATHPHERNRASYLQENFVPLKDAGVLTLVDDGAEIMPGVRYRRSGGHTPNHQVVTIESERQDGGVHRRHVSDLGARSRSVGDGLRPVSDGHAGVQARVCARSGRARVPVVLRARPVDGCRLPAREGRQALRGARLSDVSEDWNHRRQRPVRHGRADRSRREDR